MAKCPLRAMCVISVRTKRAEVPGDGEHAQQEAGIPDAVDDECLVGGGTGGVAMEIEADQQIGAQPHTFPAHEHQDVVIREDEREHGEHEQVEVSEEAVVTAFVRHVADGVDVDERADSGDEQQPDGGKRIEQESGIGMERGRSAIVLDVIHLAGVGAQPGVNDFLKGLARIVVGVSGVLPDRQTSKYKGQRHCTHADRADRRLLQLAAEKEHEGRAQGGEQWDQPDVV